MTQIPYLTSMSYYEGDIIAFPICLKIMYYLKGRERTSSISWFALVVAAMGLSQVGAKSSIQVSLVDGSDPSIWDICCCFPCISRKLDQKQRRWDSNSTWMYLQLHAHFLE